MKYHLLQAILLFYLLFKSLKNFMEKKICCFFERRDTNERSRSFFYTEIEKHIMQYNVATFYVGDYCNFDHMSVIVLNEK